MFFLTALSFSSSLTSFWFWLAVIFGIVEAVTIGIVSIWFAAGALAAMLVSLATGNFLIQFGVFLGVSAFLLLRTRSIVKDRLKIGQHKTNLDGLIGEECLVTRSLSGHEVGEVELKGKLWRARSESHALYEAGQVATALRIEGVTVILE